MHFQEKFETEKSAREFARTKDGFHLAIILSAGKYYVEDTEPGAFIRVGETLIFEGKGSNA